MDGSEILGMSRGNFFDSQDVRRPGTQTAAKLEIGAATLYRRLKSYGREE